MTWPRLSFGENEGAQKIDKVVTVAQGGWVGIQEYHPSGEVPQGFKTDPSAPTQWFTTRRGRG